MKKSERAILGLDVALGPDSEGEYKRYIRLAGDMKYIGPYELEHWDYLLIRILDKTRKRKSVIH